ncbi:uncharacterized protein LOC122456561 isoform X1 [Dermochelys coriacea]|uniref:uncharacterized protein LOC122456561 isoform X1 n=1 Tax=Dermochelys coriacea TaxID=27794 RepID=UPI001CAA1BDC|nr:uncharacterized protein LOC122456561 isoform X1 [Dermochelys coriacea]
MGLSKDLGVISRPPRSLIVLGVSRLVDSPQTPLLLTCAPEGSALPGASAAPGTLSKDLWPLGVSSSPRASPLLLGLSPRTSGPRVSLLAPRVSAAPRTLSKDLQPLGVSFGPRGLLLMGLDTRGQNSSNTRGQKSAAQGMSSEDLPLLGVPATLTSHSKDLQPLGSHLLSDHARTSSPQESPALGSPLLSDHVRISTSGVLLDSRHLRCSQTRSRDLQLLGLSSPRESPLLSGLCQDVWALRSLLLLGLAPGPPAPGVLLHPGGSSLLSGLAPRISCPWGSPPPQGSSLLSGLAPRTSSPGCPLSWDSPPSPPPAGGSHLCPLSSGTPASARFLRHHHLVSCRPTPPLQTWEGALRLDRPLPRYPGHCGAIGRRRTPQV